MYIYVCAPHGGDSIIEESEMEDDDQSIGNSNEKDDEAVSELRTSGSSERVKTLHNFALPSLKWGNQRFLRCVKAFDSSSGEDNHRLRRHVSPPPPARFPSRMMVSETEKPLQHPPPPIQLQRSQDRAAVASGSSAGEVRKKVMPLDLREVEEEVKKSSLREEESEDEIERMGKARRREKQKEVAKEEQRSPARPPWNLRTRKGASGRGGGGSSRRLNDHRKPSGSRGEEKPERQKFSVALTKKEIEEDFLAMTGHLPPRRPKKRPGNVQRQLDSVSPGSWLTEVTPETYKVQESSERERRNRKKPER